MLQLLIKTVWFGQISKWTLCGDLREFCQRFVSLSSNEVLCLVGLKIQSAEAKTGWKWTARNHELWSTALSETMGNRLPLTGSHSLSRSALVLLLHYLGIRYLKMLARSAAFIIWQIMTWSVITLSVATRASADNFQGTTKVFTEKSTPLFSFSTLGTLVEENVCRYISKLCFSYANIRVQGKCYSDAQQ